MLSTRAGVSTKLVTCGFGTEMAREGASVPFQIREGCVVCRAMPSVAPVCDIGYRRG